MNLNEELLLKFPDIFYNDIISPTICYTDILTGHRVVNINLFVCLKIKVTQKYSIARIRKYLEDYLNHHYYPVIYVVRTIL